MAAWDIRLERVTAPPSAEASSDAESEAAAAAATEPPPPAEAELEPATELGLCRGYTDRHTAGVGLESSLQRSESLEEL